MSNINDAIPQNDLREFIAAVQKRGELAVVNGAHWDKEIGAVTEVLYRQKVEKAPMVLFDEIPGYPKGYRCEYGIFGSPFRLGLILGMDEKLADDRLAQLHHFRKHVKKGFRQIKPNTVTDGPILENIVRDNAVDILNLPAPLHHELDGGRYIGTGCGVVTRDPDTGRINVGTYRVMVKGPNTVTVMISNGKQGRIHLDKYRKAGKTCPVLVIAGCDPVTYLAAAFTMADSIPEYEWAGGVMDRPVDLIEGEVTKLPFPARSEIVLEGEIDPHETTDEGPFGEWHGYYAGGVQQEPVMRIKRIYHRNDPIMTCAASQKPPHAHLFERCFMRSAGLLDTLERAGIPDVTGAWLHQAGSGRTFLAVAIKQRYFGHSTQVGLVASQVASVAYISRWIIVVDDDIDPTDIHDVIWAMGTRCDPKTRTTILDHCQSSRLDTLVNDYSKLYNSRMVIDACRPYELLDSFPPVAQTSRELAAKVRTKYPELYR